MGAWQAEALELLRRPLVRGATSGPRIPSEAAMRNFMIAALAFTVLAGCGAPSTPDFVQKAAMSDMYEVQAGKLAADKGQSEQVDAHQEAVDLFKKYASSGDNADVKQFAEKTLPTIEHHLDEAKKLPVGPPSA